VRIAIVNDLKLAQLALTRLVERAEDGEVAWVAEDGDEAIRRCREDVPDLILMDLVMPNVDGVEATRAIMRETPCPILVVTATVEGNLSKVYRALGAGALDAVSGPTLAEDGSLRDAEPALRKLRTMRRLCQPAPQVDARRRRGSSGGFPPPTIPAERLVVAGASTGGPQALVDLVRGFGPDFRPPVVVVQHLDAAFVPGFAAWLSSQTGWPAACIQGGDAPQAGTVLVAAGRDHLVMGLGRTLRYDPEPREVVYRPSVDAFYLSLARNWPTPGVAVLLTGMGQDGAKGLLALREHGWTTLAQDEASSVVWGMPRAAREIGAAVATVPLAAMGARVEREWKQLETAGRGVHEGGA
jgi:two-component system response regulator WspF